MKFKPLALPFFRFDLGLKDLYLESERTLFTTRFFVSTGAGEDRFARFTICACSKHRGGIELIEEEIGIIIGEINMKAIGVCGVLDVM